MKFNIFKSKKKSPSISRSETSFSSNTSLSSEDGKARGGSTPTSVIPAADYFEMIDRDGDGKISKEELGALLKRLGAEAAELEAMLSEVDVDGDGCITLEEFSLIGEAFAPPSCEGELRCTFQFFDANGDGRISPEELFKAFKTIGAQCTMEDCRRMIKSVDSNGDGFVCFDDFSRMMEL